MSQTGWYLIDLPTPEGWKAELTLMLVIYWDIYLSADNQSTQVLGNKFGSGKSRN